MDLHDATIIARSSHGTASNAAIEAVICSMRDAALSDLKMLSDRQPSVILVENICVTAERYAPMSVVTSGRNPNLAEILVTVSGPFWAQLAYQFGHELGHVFCNSWGPNCQPSAPCIWIEEACAEAFSLHGLLRLNERWQSEPPYPGWAEYAPHFASYADAVIQSHERLGIERGFEAGIRNISTPHHRELEAGVALRDCVKPIVPELVQRFVADKSLIEDLGALNRWPQRSAAILADYLTCWRESCAELSLQGELPIFLEDSLAHLLNRAQSS